MLDIAVDPDGPVPPFEQIRSRIAAAVANGGLPAGTRLPTVRQLASDLGLAVNTVAKAYRQLEADGVITTHGRRGTFVSSAMLSSVPAEMSDLARAYAGEARRRGLTRAEATRLVEEAWTR